MRFMEKMRPKKRYISKSLKTIDRGNMGKDQHIDTYICVFYMFFLPLYGK